MSDRLLPDWVTAYMAYTAELESPDSYHIWTALSTIAGAIQRKAFFDYKYFLVYPNMYVVLVSPAGRCKKSTAMRVGRSLLSMIPDISFTSDSTSRERLIQDLSQTLKDGHSSMTAYSSEFASLLTTSSMDMVIFLTDIYDSPPEWSHRTKIGGTNKITGPCLNIEGGTTPDWLARSLPLDTIGIGLTSRIVFVYADRPRARKPFPNPSQEQMQLREILVKDLAQIKRLSGEYVFNREAEDLYTNWYMSRTDNPNESGDPRLNGYYERKHVHVVKLAMLVTASRTDSMVMTLPDLQRSFDLLHDLEPGMGKAFSAVGKNPLALDNEIVLGAILQEPGIGIDKLMNMFRYSLRKGELEEVLETLRLGGLIKVPVMHEDGPHYSPIDALMDMTDPNLDKDGKK